MDAILSQFSADELSVRCAVQAPACADAAPTCSESLPRGAERGASLQKTYRAPLSFADASAPVADSMHQLEATYQQLGRVLEELKREINQEGVAQRKMEERPRPVK